MHIFSHGYGQLHFSMIVSWLPKENWIRSKKKRERESDLRDNDFYTALATTCFQTEPWRHIKAGPVSISGQDALVQGGEIHFPVLHSVRLKAPGPNSEWVH